MCKGCGEQTHIQTFSEGIKTGLDHLDLLSEYYPGLNIYDVEYEDMVKAVVIGKSGRIQYGELSYDLYIRELLEELTDGLYSGNQRQHIEDVLKKFSERKFQSKEWWGNLTKEEIKMLWDEARAFYLPHTQMLEDGLREAYIFGKFTKQLTDNISLLQARKKVSKETLTKFDEARISYIQDTAGLFWNRVIDRETDKVAINLLKYNRDATTEILKNPDRKAWRSLTSDIYHSIKKDKAVVLRDLDRIVRTETSASQNYAILSSAKDAGGKYFFVQLRPTACPLCKDMYLDKDGKPKKFLIDDFMDQPRDLNWGKKVKDYAVTLPPAHPYCFCRVYKY